MRKNILNKPYRKLRSVYNSWGSKKKCYVCGRTFAFFHKYRDGIKDIPEFRQRLQFVGSDVENFRCPYCTATDRERHLFMFFDKIGLWQKVKGSDVLHFAPERNLRKKIHSLGPGRYIMGDVAPKDEEIQNIDATKIQFDDDSFDLIICNHVLEHIPEHKTAMKELNRVLKPGGTAILQTPYSKTLKRTFQDENLNTDEDRLFFYGETDHFRIFSEEQFFEELESAGFRLKIVRNDEFFDKNESSYFGINSIEDLVRVENPL